MKKRQRHLHRPPGVPPQWLGRSIILYWYSWILLQYSCSLRSHVAMHKTNRGWHVVVQAYTTTTTTIGLAHYRSRQQQCPTIWSPLYPFVLSHSTATDTTNEEDADTNDPHPTTTNNNTGIRLNKVLTQRYSRRSTDQLIRQGRIQVNHVVVTDLGRRVTPHDVIHLDDQRVTWDEHVVPNAAVVPITIDDDAEDDHQPPSKERTAPPPHVYIKYWKPVGVISTTDRNVPNNLLDALERTTITTTGTTTTTTPNNNNIARQQQQQQHGRRIFNVGRLDKDSSGLLLLTSDGRVPHAVLAKEFRHQKVYRVVIDQPISYDHLAQLRRGIVITTDTVRQRKHVAATARTLPCTIEPIYHNNNNNNKNSRSMNHRKNGSTDDASFVPTTELQITLTEGRNRQIRVMLQTVGNYRVLQLHRIQFMSTIDLTHLRGPGDWTMLNATELASLQDAISSSAAASTTTVSQQQ